jgi:membrane protein implicated in regulation of membrane protease activity
VAISIGDAVLKITGDASGLDKTLSGIDGKMKKVGIAMAAVGTAIVGSLIAITLKTASAADNIEEMGQRTGLSTTLLQELDYAAKLTGTSIEGLEVATKRMAVTLNDAATGGEEAQQKLAALGLTISDLQGLSPDEQFLRIAKALGAIPDPTKRAALAIDIFGRSGTDLLPMLADTTMSLDEMLKKAHDLGLVMSEEDVKKAAALNDAITSLKAQFGGIGNAIATTLIPVFKDIVDTISKIIKAVTDWMAKHPELTKVIIAAAFGLGLLLLGFGTFILLAPGILAAGTLMGAGFWAALGPIALIIAAIAALIAIGILLIKNWDKIVDFFTGSNRQMTKELKAEQEKQTKIMKEAHDKQRADAVAANTKAKTDLRNHYGVLEGYTKQENKTLMDLAKDASKARGKAIDIEMDALGRAHDEKMRMIDEEYNAKVDALDAETNAAIAALEGQLDAMDAEDKATTRSEEDQGDTKRLQQIQNAIINARNVFEQKSAEKELAAFQAEMADKYKERGRADKRESLQAQISTLREQAANQQEALQTEHEAKVKQEEELYNASKTRLDNEKENLDAALETELIRLEEERLAFEDAEDAKLTKLNESLANQETALIAFHEREMARIDERAKAGAVSAGTTGTTEKGWWQKFLDFMNKPISFQGFEGIIPGIPGTPIPAVVHAGEYIGQSAPSNTVNIYNPVVRSDNDIREITKQVSREMYRMQQVRYG